MKYNEMVTNFPTNLTFPFGKEYAPFGETKMHTGVDLRPIDDKVWALFPGKVSLAEERKEEGRFVQIVSNILGMIFKHNYFHNESSYV